MSTPKKIRICHLTSVHPALDTRIFFKECIALTEEYEIILIAPGVEKREINDVKIIPVRAYKNRPLRFLLTDLELLVKALFVNARLYHFHDPELIPLGFFLRLLGKKVIYDVHEDVRADLKEKYWLRAKALFQKGYDVLDKWAQKAFYIVLAEESYIRHYSGSKYVVVQNFVEPGLFVPFRKTSDIKSNSILFVGTLAGKRGLEAVTKALALLKKDSLTIQLICVGRYDERVEAMFEAIPEYESVREQVIFRGYKPIPAAYADATNCFAGIAIPEDLENHRESYSTKMFEYMACGLPVISADFPLYASVIEKYDCGVCVPPHDMHAVAEAIRSLYQNQVAGSCNGGIKAVETEFNWNIEKQKLLDLYKEALQ